MRGEREKLNSILPREIGDRDDPAFLPKQAVRKGRNVAHVNPGANDNAAFAHGRECGRHQLSNRRIDDRGIERFRRLFVRLPPRRRRDARQKLARPRLLDA